MSMRTTFAEQIEEIGDRDSRLVLLVGDISHGIMKRFAAKHPERYYNIGICEPAMVNMASGLSHVGLIPVLHTIAPFLIERSFEQLKLDFAYQKRSVNLVSVGSGFDYSKLGCSHHCYTDIALIRQLPNSRVFVPGSNAEFESQFNTWYDKPGINYFRLSENDHQIEFDKDSKQNVFREGLDLTIVALGPRLPAALEAAEKLGAASVSAEVIYLSDFSEQNIDNVRSSVKKTRRLITVEEHSVQGGLNSFITSALSEESFQIEALGVRDFIHAYGSYGELCEVAGVSTDSIVSAAFRLIKGLEQAP